MDFHGSLNEKDSLKVLYVTHYGSLYGANRSMMDMILELRNKYNIIPYVLLNEHGDLEKELQKNSIKYIYRKYFGCAVYDDGKIKTQFKRVVKKIVRFFSYAIIAKQIKNNFDIVHSNSSIVDIGYYISQKYRCAHIWHIREFGKEDYNFIQIDGVKKIKNRYKNTDCVIAISKAIGKMLIDLDEKIAVNVIYNGVKISEKYKKNFLRDNKIHFCIVGVVCKSKNQMEAVRAVNNLAEKGYKNLYLHIIGGGTADGEFDFIKKYIKENHLDKYIELWGYRYDVDTVLKKMDVGIMCSYKEAFGRVTIEYMSNYMPVIGANTGGTKELIEDKYNGFLYDAGNFMDLSEKMERLLNCPYLLKEMGIKARKVAEKFTANINADNVYRIYVDSQSGKQ